MPYPHDTTTSHLGPDLRPATPAQRTTEHGPVRQHAPVTAAASPPIARRRLRRIAARIGRMLLAAIRPRPTSIPPRPARDIATQARRRTDDALLTQPTTRPPDHR